ncbi:LCP family protein [bacterium]|nr:LCP family protein [bacterium]
MTSRRITARNRGRMAGGTPALPRDRRQGRLRHLRHKPWYLRKRFLWPASWLAIGFGLLAYWSWNMPVENPVTRQPEILGKQFLRAGQALFKPDRSLEVAFRGQDQFRVLLVGLDEVPRQRKDPNPPHRADAVMVLSTDLKSKQVRALSIPRDGWVQHTRDGGRRIGYDKLAHTYVYGGIERTKDTVENLLGLPTEYYVIVEIEGFVQLIDALGGLTVEVEKDMNYDDNRGDLHIHLAKGTQLLNGEQVMQYARFRHDALGDIGRMQRQQKLIRLIFTALTDARNVRRLPELARIVKESVQTNLGLDQLIALAQHMGEYSQDGIKTMTLTSYWNREPGHELELPGAIEGREVDAQVIFKSDADAAREFLSELSAPQAIAADGARGWGEHAAAAEDAAEDNVL